MRNLFLLSLLFSVFASLSIQAEPTTSSYGVSSDGTKLEFDFYPPQATNGNSPAIILVHGGGWTGGSRAGFSPIAEVFNELGYAVLNIEYRLATKAKFPGAVLDVAAAVRWTRAHAEEHRIDPDQIFLVGGSAGGHLAAMVATTGHTDQYNDGKNWTDQSSEVAGFVIMGTGVDQVTRVKESGRVESCVIFFGAEYEDNPAIYAEGSPITHVSKQTPPVLMIEGENDRPGKRYVDWSPKLDALGVRNELVVVPEAKHGQWGKEPYRSQFVKGIDEFLKSL